MKKIWNKISQIGIDETMPVQKQKGIILLNRISVLIFIFFVFITIMSYKKLEDPIVGHLYVLNLIIILITFLITKLGKSDLSKFIISIFIPLSLTVGGAYAKYLGVTDNLILYLSPRMLLTISIIIPTLLFGYKELRKTIIALIPGIIIFVLYDKIHALFGIYLKDLPFEPEYYSMFLLMIFLFLVFVISSILFLQNINLTNELKLQETNNNLAASEEELKQQNEEISAINENLREQQKIILEQNKKIKISEKRFKNIATLIPEIVFEADINGKLTYVSNHFFENTFYTQEDVNEGIIYTNLLSKKSFHEIRRQIILLRKIKELRNLKVEINRKDGTSFYALISINLNKFGYRGLIIDISEREKINEEMRKLIVAVEQSDSTIVITNTLGEIEYINPIFSKLTGYTKEEVLGQNPRILKSEHHNKAFYKTLWTRIIAGHMWKGTFKNRKKNGDVYWEQATISPIKNSVGEITNFVAVKEDITKRKESEKKLGEAFITIRKKNEDITKSINYAKLIQTAILPSENILKNNFAEYFIFNKPKDIVGGDFYYFHENEINVTLAVADSTGHGVPGGFMTMLGHAFLDDIVNRKNTTTTGEILDKLRENIINSLGQSYDNTGSKDGMDISICKIEKNSLKTQFSGAYNPILIINELQTRIIKADKMPIGVYIKMKPFTTEELQLKKNDLIYMFTDGFQDQFGGEKNQKYMARNFRNLLSSNKNKSLNIQNEIIENELNIWKGNKSQLDDILILGLKI